MMQTDEVFYTNDKGYAHLPLDSGQSILMKKQGYELGLVTAPSRSGFVARLTTHQPLPNGLERYVGNREQGVATTQHKVGVWEYYDKPGTISLLYDHDNYSPIYIKKDTSGYFIETPTGWKRTKIDVQPRYIGSMATLSELLNKVVKYPEEAKRKKAEGAFYVTFDIDTTGLAVNFEALGDIGHGCGTSAITALANTPTYWIPAHANGRKKKTKVAVVLYFYHPKNHSGEHKFTHPLPSFKPTNAKILNISLFIGAS